MSDPTHADLLELGRRWLLKSSYTSWGPEQVNRSACSVILTEVTSHALETPDVLGWSSVSVLIECKASRADFLADQRKMSRKIPENGMGVLRYYLAPDGLLSDEEIPEGWGHLVAIRRTSGKGYYVRISRQSKIFQAAHECEVQVLLALLRGLKVMPEKCLTIKTYIFQTKKRGTLTMRATAHGGIA